MKLSALNSTKRIYHSRAVFSYIDHNFRVYNANVKSSPTPSIAVSVHKLEWSATFEQMFRFLNDDAEKLCLTQHQILNFITLHRHWLKKDGHSTFFLFKSHGQFFVAGIDFSGDGTLKAFVNRFEEKITWGGDGKPRVVVPELSA